MLSVNRARLVFIFVCSFFLFSCEYSRRAEMLVGNTMSTTYTIKFIANSSIDLNTIHEDIEGLLSNINSTMSTYDPDSELSLLNKNNSAACIPVSNSLGFVINNAIEISQMTQGSFDITVGPLVDLWGFGPSAIPSTKPDYEELNSVKVKVGYNKINLNTSKSCLTKQHSDIYIDLSAIAKGYAVDEVARILNLNAVDNFMVEIGGEVKAYGENINKIPWQIGIEKPVDEQRSVQKIIALQNYGLATSGDYRNYFEHEGKRYSHLIDASTGSPIEHNLVSVTVLHESTMIADALATALMIKGDEKGLEIAEQNELAVLFILKDGDDFLEKPSELFNKLTKH